MYVSSIYQADAHYYQKTQQSPISKADSAAKIPLPTNSVNHDYAAFKWHQRIIKKLDGTEVNLDKFIPNLRCQTIYDQWCSELNTKSEAQNPFNDWLKNNGHGEWYEQLAIFLAKLPLRAARNIMSFVFKLIQASIILPTYALMHPMKSCVKLAKLFIELLHALTQPETWSKVGISIVGSTLGQATITGNPLGVIAIAIGGALAIAGISIGTLKTAILAEKGSRQLSMFNYLSAQTQQLSEDLLTGYCSALLIEAIKQILLFSKK